MRIKYNRDRLTYKKASQMLQGRCRLRRRIADATYLVRDGRKIHMEYLGARIVTLSPNGSVRLDRSGHDWHNFGTRFRMNLCISGYVNTWRTHWYVSMRSFSSINGWAKYSFRDGMTIKGSSVTGYDPEPLKDKLKAYNRKIYQRNKPVSVEQVNWRGQELEVGDIGIIQPWHRNRKSKEMVRIERLWRNSNTGTCWARLRTLNGRHVVAMTEQPDTQNTQKLWDRWNLAYCGFKKDNFLSAVKQAKKESETAA